jgi:hypothetical protein
LWRKKKETAMVKSDYYRRQADLCLRLALAQRDQKAAISLVEFAEELMSKAEEAAAFHAGHIPASAPTEAASARL